MGAPSRGQVVWCTCIPRNLPARRTVQLDQFHGPVLLDAEAHLEKYRRLLGVVEAIALSPGKSRDLIHSIDQSL
ncbi:Scr1 family TA system antitoxin-like transcriptional regulator [Streptomyces sp. NPDC005374]|uniref:Scr1 family TA system antitoxin-like transcriptional regulator n=1 Tax=Streptomyces sp. NPDC005374 TaxID=3364713 RepID=UPI0036C36915